MEDSLHSGTPSRADVASVVADLMVPVTGPAVSITHSLRQAANRIAQGEAAVVVEGLHNSPIGFICPGDLLALAGTDPFGWQKKRCASAVQLCESLLEVGDSIESVIDQYRHLGIRALLVFNDGSPVGLLRPAEVRRWCHDHRHPPLEELIYAPALNLKATSESESGSSELVA